MFSVPARQFLDLFRDGSDDGSKTPDAIFCATCGKPLSCLNSFGLSTPIKDPLNPQDFCNLICLSTWLIKARNMTINHEPA